ncbi:hypothetical protein ACIQZG_07305 [Lysinibacillus sp. NPDC096418]|uniref:hypothetical protein n=1 Tax=Lysinibacillus sp. NPDC096418 TaxID=3364138 RepID=UPI0038155A74
MEIFSTILSLIYVLIFFIAVFISLKFEWSEENKDECGKSISSKSYGIVFPLMPLGWFLIEMYDQFVRTLSYDTYKLTIWYLLTGLMILQAVSLTVLKRKY